ncbi:DUF262 domain-containing protein [Bosea thiooxidans]|nr:DUF262 domain-containing HNH endonuclease family protein [Bosea sp. (in: a-proteobacteria)]
MSDFTFQPTTLLGVLQSGFYAVPMYQRSYSWSEQQVSDFWNDIKEAIEGENQYFLGTLVFSNEDGGFISVIDGQQRLATTTIILSAIKEKYESDGKIAYAATYSGLLSPLDPEDGCTKPRIRLNAEDHPYFSKLVLDGVMVDADVDSHKRILEAFQYFKRRIAEIVDADPSNWEPKIARIWKFLNKQARVVTVTAPNDADAFTIFETLNDRGADLTIADLLKNYLFSQAGNINIGSVQLKWQSANTILKEYQEEKMFIVFLRHLWSSMHGATRERDLFRDIKSEVRGAQASLDFATKIEESAKLYAAILSSDNDFWADYSAEDRGSVRNINEFNLQQSRPTLLAALEHFDKTEIKKTLAAFISIFVRGIIAGGIGGGQAERYLSDAAADIRSGAIKNTAQLVVKLKPIIPSDTVFERAFQTFSTTTNRFARYLLVALEKGMKQSAQPELVPNEDVEKVNLEHILPRSATASDWPAFTAEERATYPNRLGNMTLLSKGINNRIGNKSWSVKKAALSGSELDLNKVISAEADWRTGEIDKRQAALAKQALTVWKV